MKGKKEFVLSMENLHDCLTEAIVDPQVMTWPDLHVALFDSLPFFEVSCFGDFDLVTRDSRSIVFRDKFPRSLYGSFYPSILPHMRKLDSLIESEQWESAYKEASFLYVRVSMFFYVW